MIGRNTFSALAIVLGPPPKNWLCHPLPLFKAVSIIPNVIFELLLHAAFVANEIWGGLLEPARRCIYIIYISICRYVGHVVLALEKSDLDQVLSRKRHSSR